MQKSFLVNSRLACVKLYSEILKLKVHLFHLPFSWTLLKKREGTEDYKSKKRENQFHSVAGIASNFKTSVSLLFFLKQKIIDTFLFETLGNPNYNKGKFFVLEIKETSFGTLHNTFLKWFKVIYSRTLPLQEVFSLLHTQNPFLDLFNKCSKKWKHNNNKLLLLSIISLMSMFFFSWQSSFSCAKYSLWQTVIWVSIKLIWSFN